MPRRPTIGVLLLLLAAGTVGAAAPARAVEDPGRPHATVLRGPSCDPGGLQVQVRGGTTGYHAVLATTRHPEGEDAADVPAGATVLLRTADVAWGETLDPRLGYTALGGSGGSDGSGGFVDELDAWTLTRPAEADCAAAVLPSPAPSAAPSPAPAGAGTTAVPVPAPPSAPVPPAPVPSAASPAPAAPSAVVTDGAAAADGAASRAVGAGAPITVTGHGFAPGERVTLRLAGTGAVLARGTAGSDGVVALRLTVPARASGPTGVDVVGDRSQDAARLQLQVAALRQPLAAAERGGGTAGVAPAAALAALLAAGAGLVVTARGAGGRRGGPTAGG